MNAPAPSQICTTNQSLGKGPKTVLSKTVLSARFESTVSEKTVFRALGRRRCTPGNNNEGTRRRKLSSTSGTVSFFSSTMYNHVLGE